MSAGGNQRSQKDREMAASLARTTEHSPDGVKRRKRRQHEAFMGQLSGQRTGSAAYQRRVAR